VIPNLLSEDCAFGHRDESRCIPRKDGYRVDERYTTRNNSWRKLFRDQSGSSLGVIRLVVITAAFDPDEGYHLDEVGAEWPTRSPNALRNSIRLL